MENNFFKINLKTLTQIYSQKKVASDTGFSPSSITNYINGVSEPSIAFLVELKKIYGISLDEFLFSEIKRFDEIIIKESANKRFLGNYIVYYYDSSASMGKVNSDRKNTLSYGVVSILNKTSGENGGLETFAHFLMSRKEAEKNLEFLNSLQNEQEIVEYYSKSEKKYEGYFTKSSGHLFFNLESKIKTDSCFIILNNPPSDKTYIGGLGTVNSITSGRERMPCIQFIIISKNIIKKPDGEIYNLLGLDIPDIIITSESDQLINLFKTLYMTKGDLSNILTEYQKQNIIENTFKNILKDYIEANMFRFAKVSDENDDKFYRLIKDEAINGK